MTYEPSNSMTERNSFRMLFLAASILKTSKISTQELLDAVDHHDLLEVDTVRLEDPLLARLRLDTTIRHDLALILLVQEHVLHALNTTEVDAVQHRVLQLAQEDILLDRPQPIVVLISSTQHTTTNNEVIAIVINSGCLLFWPCRGKVQLSLWF